MEATPTQIIHFFSGFKQNVVPLYQRPYTWTEKQWKALWIDIISFYDRDDADSKSTHFMGAVVTMPARSVPVGVSKFLVIDGQQRLTTVALLLCALRDSLNSNEPPARRIQNHYLTNDGYEGLENFKLLPTQGDRAAYSPIVQKSGTVTDSPFKKGYEYFLRRLRDPIDEDDRIDPARILKIIETRLMVVSINLSDTDDPYLIFESLNVKGAPLEQADLVRNYFLMQFPVSDQQKIYADLWLPMQTRLGSDLTEFMRHFLGAEGEEVRKGDVYAAIKRRVADVDPPAVNLLMSRMERLSVFYSRITTPTNEPHPDVSHYFEHFQRLDFGTAYPLLLALYEDYNDGQIDIGELLEVLRILHSFIIRRMIVGVPSNSLSKLFVSLCKNKPATETPSGWLSGVLARESKTRRWPADDEFTASWVNANLYENRRTCQIVLECIEEQFGHHEAVQDGQGTVEHVMPQTLTPEWEKALGPEAAAIHARWLHTVGNLTLTGYNPELSNRSYKDKRAVFALSHYELNRYFGDVEKWDAEEIVRRATYLGKIALELWPRPQQLPEEEPSIEKVSPASFHGECIRLVQQHLKVNLSKLSQTRYASGNGSVRLVCAVSAEHNEASDLPYYWFALHQSQLDFLAASTHPWVCLGCGSPKDTLLLPPKMLQNQLEFMSMTKGDDRHYWHIVIQRRNGRLMLRLLGGKDGPELSQFSVAS